MRAAPFDVRLFPMRRSAHVAQIALRLIEYGVVEVASQTPPSTGPTGSVLGDQRYEGDESGDQGGRRDPPALGQAGIPRSARPLS
jgi:hypothetical protein